MNKRRRYKAKARRLMALRMSQGKWIDIDVFVRSVVSYLSNKIELVDFNRPYDYAFKARP